MTKLLTPQMSRRLFQIVVTIILAAATLTPLLETFDRWDKNPGPNSDTEIHITAWFVGLGAALVVARALRYVPRLAKIGRQVLASEICTAFVSWELPHLEPDLSPPPLTSLRI